MTEVTINSRKQFGSKAYLQKIEVGKWFAFDVVTVGTSMTGYGKVVAINDDGTATVDRYFQLPSYRPYAAHKWFDSLPFAVND